MSLRLFDMSDRELLALIRDLRDNEGVIETSDIVERMWGAVEGDERKHLMRCVGIRLAWMQRFGVVEKVRSQHWRLTERGEAILHATIRRAQARLIEDTEDAALPSLLSVTGQRYMGAGYTARKISRREFIFATGRRD